MAAARKIEALFPSPYWGEHPLAVKKCLACGLIFETDRDKKYCSARCAHNAGNRRWRARYPEKQRLSSQRWKEKNPGKARTYQISWWNNKGNKGTFPERYLSIFNGRVYGAILLERDKRRRARSHGGFVNPWIARYSGDNDGRCEECGSDMMIIIGTHQAYCNECGSKVVLAIKNQHYSLTEFTCDSCGLVYPF
jgi:DNA-directed RNA polymerase subunit RPC12/RpoP